MRRIRGPRSAVAVAVVTVALLVAGCGSSSDPSSWEEAETQQIEDDGTFAVERNFNTACREANSGEAGFNDTAARAYCRCAFMELRESLTFEEFDALDKDLRNNPNPDALDGIAASAWRIAEPLLEGCADDATA